MKKIIYIIITLSLTIFFSTSPIYSAEHSKNDVLNLIGKAKIKLDSIKKSIESEIIESEIIKIDDHIRSAQNLLSTGKIDQSFYEISIGIIYFILIDAKIDLHNAQNELEDTKNKLAK